MNLQILKNEELESELKKLIQKERQILHLVILHIQEVNRRKIYLQKAYSSLFEYLVKEMSYSVAAAQRRVEAARLVTEIPEVHQKIESGEINLSQICDIQRAIKQAEKIHGEKVGKDLKADLVLSVLGESTQETQKICAQKLNIPVKEYERVKVQANGSRRIEGTPRA